jgi:hypothetical protein
MRRKASSVSTRSSPPDFFAYAIGSQQIAHPPLGADDAQCDAPGGKFAMQLVQHVRAGEIEIG